MPTCPKCGAGNAADARFCQACGAGLAGSERTVRKTVTVLFSDFVDWTKLAESLDPESARRVQELLFDAMAEAIRAHGGTVEQYAGDAIYAVFGLPVVHEDDALRAVRAAVEMRERRVRVNDELEQRFGVRVDMRTGVNTGEVAVGTGKTIATGSAVNLGRRLEQAASADSILIGPGTYRLVRRSVDVEPVAVDAKGYPEPVSAYRLRGLSAVTSPKVGARLQSPMIGRGQEQAMLRQVLERSARDRTCQLFTVLGPAGVGKSRLVAEVLGELDGGARRLSGRCLPYGEGITFWPLGEVVRQAFGPVEAGSGSGDLIEKMTAALDGDSRDEARAIADTVARLIGVVESPVGVEEGFRAIRRLLHALARERPLVVVFDDIQWGEPTFLDLVEHIAEWSHDTPLVLVCMARPELFEERPDWGGGRLNAAAIMLEPLDDEESEQLIAGLLGEQLEPRARRRITESAEGNPLFVEEILEMLIDDGLLVRVDSTWTAARELSPATIPATIHALLEARLERLDADERAVLECAAVEGKVFHRGSVEALSEPGIDLESRLTSLARKELIRPDRPVFAGDEAFRFRHILIRDAAYKALSKATRAELHERYADWLERVAASRLAEVEEIAGYHLEQACRYLSELDLAGRTDAGLAARAAARLETAGRRALARSDLPAAINLLERSTALLPEADPARVALLTELGATLMEGGKLADADRALTEAEREADVLGDERLGAHALVQRLFLRLQVATDATGEALAAVERVIPLFERHEDELGLCRTRRLEAWVHWIHGRTHAAEVSWRQAAEHAHRAGAVRDEAEVLVWLASAALFGYTPASEGVARCEHIRPRLAGRRVQEALLLYPLAGMQAMLGRFDDARDLLAQAKAILIDFGVTMSANSHPEALVAMLAQDPAEAERCLRADYDNLALMGEKGFLSTTAALLARAVEEQGRDDEAYELTRVAEREGASDDFSTQIGWRGVRARIVARRGQLDEAERFAREAVALSELTDRLNSQGDALADLAAVLERAGREAEAVAANEEALDRYDQKDNVVAADRVRATLAALPAR